MSKDLLSSFTTPSAPTGGFASGKSKTAKAGKQSDDLVTDFGSYSEEGAEDGDVLAALGLTTEDAQIMLTSALASIFTEGPLNPSKIHANSIGAQLIEVITTSLNAKSNNRRKIGLMAIVTQLREVYKSHTKYKTALYDVLPPVTAAHVAFAAPWKNSVAIEDLITELRSDPNFNENFRFTGPFSALIHI